MAMIKLGTEILPDPLEQQYRRMKIDQLRQEMNPTGWQKFTRGLQETRPLWEPLYNIGTSALQQYIGQKLGNKFNLQQQAQRAQAYEQLGRSPAEATGLAGMPDDIQRMAFMQQLQAPAQQVYGDVLGQLLGIPQSSTTQASQMQEMQYPSYTPQEYQSVVPMSLQQEATPERIMMQDYAYEAEQPLKQQQMTVPIKSEAKLQALSRETLDKLSPVQLSKLTNIALKENQHKESMSLKREANADKREAAKWKATKEYRTKVTSGAARARNELNDLKLMRKLTNSGKMNSPIYSAFLKRLNLDIGALMNPESDLFKKISIGFLRGAKEIFGARVTNFEAETFLRAIPNLEQTPEQQRLVEDNLILYNEGKLLNFKAMRDIIKEHDGIPPYDLDGMVEERIGDQLDIMAEHFRDNLDKLSSTPTNFPALPNPEQYKGAQLRVKTTGEIYESNGDSWQLVARR